MTPYKSKLLARFVAALATKFEGVGGGMRWITDQQYRRRIVVESNELIEAAITAVKAASDNPCGDDEEAICKLLLEKMDAKLGR